MDEREAKWMEELREDLGYETIEDEGLVDFAEERKRVTLRFEECIRARGSHWPENLVEGIFRLKSVELKESVDGVSLEETLSDVLDMLSPRENIVIQKFYREEKSLKELGDEFNVFYQDIYSVLSRAHETLRRPVRARRISAYIAKSEDDPDPYGFNDDEEE